jgi:hypothetical protein
MDYNRLKDMVNGYIGRAREWAGSQGQAQKRGGHGIVVRNGLALFLKEWEES